MIEMRGGQPLIDATDLGQLLDLVPSEVQNHMRHGLITSRYEVGEGEDEGKVRLTFFYEGKRVRLTCTERGEVLKISRVQGR